MLDLLEVATPGLDVEGQPTSTMVLTSVSSDGKVNLYDLVLLARQKKVGSSTELVEIHPSASHDTDGTRLTCVNAVGMAERKGLKGDGGEEGEEESDSDSEDEEDDSEEEGEDIVFGSEDELEGESEEEEEEEGEEE